MHRAFWVSGRFADAILRNDGVYIAGIKNNTRTTYELKSEIISVILNAVKNLAVSADLQPRIDLEILRYAQDDSVNNIL